MADSVHRHHHAHHRDQREGDHDAPDPAAMATILDLDAAVTGHYRDEAIDVISARVATPQTILDLGAGTGAGTLALARRFPTARVIALDNSPELLGRLSRTAQAAGCADRVETRIADLDTAVPGDLDGADIAWASSTLHHFADPQALLHSTFAALRPGGVIAVLEISALPSFLPPDSPEGVVEGRLHDLTAQQGWNAYPDWGHTITAAGFDLVEHRQIVTDLADPPSATAEYAATWFARVRDGLRESISNDDLAVVDELLADDHPNSLHHRQDLTVRAARIIWIGVKP
ncbi:class I SAM-dependent methyltransferase [Gordonia sp. CPCC 206044]|uniref:class I SAM-dependent methyltransferase n=1 Tax=Gordonia sp. CPCC 206044 TaxID=3140793 RepID=UPI003AF3C056